MDVSLHNQQSALLLMPVACTQAEMFPKPFWQKGLGQSVAMSSTSAKHECCRYMFYGASMRVTARWIRNEHLCYVYTEDHDLRRYPMESPKQLPFCTSSNRIENKPRRICYTTQVPSQECLKEFGSRYMDLLVAWSVCVHGIVDHFSCSFCHNGSMFQMMGSGMATTKFH